MNLLEKWVKEIHSEAECIEDWTKEEWAKDKKFISVDITTNCWGRVQREVHTFSTEQWDRIKEQGYWLC